MKVTILCTSPKKNSNTLKLSRNIVLSLEKREITDISLIEFSEYDIPLMSMGGLDENNLTKFQKNLIEKIGEAELVFIVVPEYNWTVPAEVTNMIHELADKKFKHIFDKKVFALAGLSSGKGGKQPVIQLTYILNKIISFFDLDSLVSPKIFESHFTQDAIDEFGASKGNHLYDRGLNAFIDYALKVCKRWHR